MIKYLILGFVGIPVGGFCIAIVCNYYYTGKFLITIPPIITQIEKFFNKCKQKLKKRFKSEEYLVIDFDPINHTIRMKQDDGLCHEI